MSIHTKDNKVLSSTDVDSSFSEDLEDNYSDKSSEEEYSELFNFYIIQNRSRSRIHSCSEDHNDYKNSCSNECQKDLDIETNCQRIEKTTKSTMTIHNKLKQNDESTITSDSEVITTVENAIVPYDINVPNNDRQQQSSSIVPYFTIFMIMMNCSTYLYGIFFMMNLKDVQITSSSLISPPQPSWYFVTVTEDWSASPCLTLRYDVWRLISYQFVHICAVISMSSTILIVGSVMHLSGNCIAILSYGALLESFFMAGFLKTMVIYQSSIIIGAYGHSYIWPYVGVIGASPGAYGLFGACLASVLFNRTYEKTWLVANHVKTTITILIIITLLVQIIYDICYYILQYNERVSYASHIFGLYSGFMIALSLNMYRKLYIYKIIGIIALVAVLMQIIYLLYNHYHYWPPRPYIQSWIHNESNCNGCCSQLYRYMSKYSLSYEKAISTVECIDDHLYPPF